MRGGLGGRPVFSVGERVLRWDDVVGWAGGSGDLAVLEHETALAIAALERDGPPDPAAVRAAGTEFRYARSLLAADELEAWLARWELTTDDWLAHLRRSVAAERARGPEPEGLAAASDADVLTDAICSGELARWAGELAARLAVAPDADGDELEARFAAYCRDAVTEEAVAREVEGRRLDWLRVEGELVSLADEDAAREVALCAREDGDPLDELAARSHGELERLDAYLEDVAPELAPALLGARDGEILGPLAIEGRFVVARAHRKTAPRADDPTLRERAAGILLARALAREVESRVSWHEQL